MYNNVIKKKKTIQINNKYSNNIVYLYTFTFVFLYTISLGLPK